MVTHTEIQVLLSHSSMSDLGEENASPATGTSWPTPRA